MSRLGYALAIAALVIGAGSCGAKESQLRTRAAFDLNCPENQLKITKLDERTRGVRACGQQATYVESCNSSNRTNCTWVLNTDSHPR